MLYFKHMHTLLRQALDFLFPPHCVACDDPGAWWCETCRGSVEKISGQVCPRCLSVGCDQTCQGQLPFKSVTSFGYYHDPKLRAVITALKFKGATALMEDVEKFMHANAPAIPEVDAIIPVPLSDKRERERGFNQAQLMAQALKPCLNSDAMIYESVLCRVAHRQAQSSLEHDVEARKNNVKGAFSCRALPKPRILLVDDVATTGATAASAAQALLDAGATEVHLVTLAIGA